MNESNLRSRQKFLLKFILVTFCLAAGSQAYAVDWLAPFKSVKKLFHHDDSIVVWQAPGQYVKIVDQDWDHDHRRAPPNDQPATISAPHLAVVLDALRAWRPEDTPEAGNSVRLFTNEEISLLAPKLSEALSRAGPKQDVVFGVTGTYENFPQQQRRATAARVFVYDGKLNMIFGDVLRPAANADPSDISEYDEPHRAGRRIASNGRDIIVKNGIGIDHYTYFTTPRLDWIQIDVPQAVAAYGGPHPAVNPVQAASVEPVANAVSYPVDSSLSKENRKLREELAHLRQATGENQSGATAMAQPQPSPAQQPQSAPAPQYRKPAPAAPSANAKVAGSRNAAPPPDKIQTPAMLDSIQKRLQLLKNLHDKGLITDQEYNAKRKEIVEEI